MQPVCGLQRNLYAMAVANIQLMSMLFTLCNTRHIKKFLDNTKEFNTFVDRAEEEIASRTTGEGSGILIHSIHIASTQLRYFCYHYTNTTHNVLVAKAFASPMR